MDASLSVPSIANISTSQSEEQCDQQQVVQSDPFMTNNYLFQLPYTPASLYKNKASEGIIDIIDMALDLIDNNSHCDNEDMSYHDCEHEQLISNHDHIHNNLDIDRGQHILDGHYHDRNTPHHLHNENYFLPISHHDDALVQEIVAQNDRLNMEVTELFGSIPFLEDDEPIASDQIKDTDATMSCAFGYIISNNA